MSRCDGFSKPRAYPSHYSVVLSRGTRARTFRLRPGVLVGILSVVPVLAVGCFALTLLFVFRDDLLWSLMSRQAEMQYVYEDRLASMRTQIERLKSRELLNEQRAAHPDIDLPEIPPTGDLDIRQVLESPYFFA